MLLLRSHAVGLGSQPLQPWGHDKAVPQVHVARQEVRSRCPAEAPAARSDLSLQLPIRPAADPMKQAQLIRRARAPATCRARRILVLLMVRRRGAVALCQRGGEVILRGVDVLYSGAGLKAYKPLLASMDRDLNGPRNVWHRVQQGLGVGMGAGVGRPHGAPNKVGDRWVADRVAFQVLLGQASVQRLGQDNPGGSTGTMLVD
mmetsp:Transcript_19832/g.55144  ORF Transcript_19832/g.55144 Transcript_19832/m.55144 type:complete len:203 (-) Transcript_19832:1036-1644(-)